MNAIIIEVLGLDPKPQPRARSFILRGKGGKPIVGKNGQPILRVHESGTAEQWKGMVAEAAKQQPCPFPPLSGPLRVDIEFRFSRPNDHFRKRRGVRGDLKPGAPHWHIARRGDRDNLDKAILDTLTVLGIWDDDSQACDGRIQKRYCVNGERPGATIVITPLEQPTIQPANKEKEGVLL